MVDHHYSNLLVHIPLLPPIIIPRHQSRKKARSSTGAATANKSGDGGLYDIVLAGKSALQVTVCVSVFIIPVWGSILERCQ